MKIKIKLKFLLRYYFGVIQISIYSIFWGARSSQFVTIRRKNLLRIYDITIDYTVDTSTHFGRKSCTVQGVTFKQENSICYFSPFSRALTEFNSIYRKLDL